MTTSSTTRTRPDGGGEGIGAGLLPPHDAHAEQCLVGAAILDAARLDDVAHLVTPASFYLSHLGTIFDACCRLHHAGKAVDLATVEAELRSMQMLEEVGGIPALVQCVETVPVTAHALSYAELVREQERRRLARRAFLDGVQGVGDESTDMTELVSDVQTRLDELSSEDVTVGEPTQDIRTVLMEAFGDIMSGRRAGIPTGFHDLDRLTGGLHGGNLVIVAARPGMGKTALALQVMLNMARAGRLSLLFTMEQSLLEVAERFLSMHARVDGNRIRRNLIDDQERHRLLESSTALSDLPILLNGITGQRVSQIAATCRRTKRKHGLGLVVLDYLQLLSPDDRRASREQQVADMSRQLKILAKTLDVPVFCLAQLNREVEKREDKKPRLSDLRESGSIEQDSDQVWMLWRPQLYALLKKKGLPSRDGMPATPDVLWEETEAFALVTKNRSGNTGDVPLHWQKEFTLFQDSAALTYDEELF